MAFSIPASQGFPRSGVNLTPLRNSPLVCPKWESRAVIRSSAVGLGAALGPGKCPEGRSPPRQMFSITSARLRSRMRDLDPRRDATAVHHTSVTKGRDHRRDLPPDGVTMLLRSPLAIAALALASMPLMHFAQASKPDVDAFIQRWDADHDEAISRDDLRNATGDPRSAHRQDV